MTFLIQPCLFQIQPKKPGPFGYETPNFKCEKASETLYVTETEWTFDKKCYTVYKVQCSDGYDTGKVISSFPTSSCFLQTILILMSGLPSSCSWSAPLSLISEAGCMWFLWHSALQCSVRRCHPGGFIQGHFHVTPAFSETLVFTEKIILVSSYFPSFELKASATKDRWCCCYSTTS